MSGMKDLCIFGCGNHASQVYYRLRRRGYSIKYIFDNYIKKPFYGMEIVKIRNHIEELDSMYILVTNDLYFKDVKEQLEEYGLKEFNDFIKADAFEKKIVFINGNCYAQLVGIMLRRCDDFNSKYYVYENHPIMFHPNEINTDLLRNCDVFIHQDIQVGNKYNDIFADEMTIPQLKDGCVNICMPNLVGLGMIIYPQTVAVDTISNNMFPYRDVIIDDLVKRGYSVDDIVYIICNCSIFSEKILEREFDNIICKFRKREEKWDIKIIDFILDNFKKNKCFVDGSHPTDRVFRKIVSDILKILGIDYGPSRFNEYNRDYFQNGEIIIYPEVARYFGLDYWSKDGELRQYTSNKMCKMNMEEYVREYIFIYYDKI